MEFHEGSVVRTWCFHSLGPGLTPSHGIVILKVMWYGQKIPVTIIRWAILISDENCYQKILLEIKVICSVERIIRNSVYNQ